jgi:hypothetical protein
VFVKCIFRVNQSVATCGACHVTPQIEGFAARVQARGKTRWAGFRCAACLILSEIIDNSFVVGGVRRQSIAAFVRTLKDDASFVGWKHLSGTKCVFRT